MAASVEAHHPQSALPEDWQSCDDAFVRDALSSASTAKGKEWFKSIHHGEFLGDVIFENFSKMEDDVHLKKILVRLSDWIDESK